MELRRVFLKMEGILVYRRVYIEVWCWGSGGRAVFIGVEFLFEIRRLRGGVGFKKIVVFLW